MGYGISGGDCSETDMAYTKEYTKTQIMRTGGTYMVRKLRNVMAVMLAATAVVASPVNVFAMSGPNNGIVTYNYSQESSCEKTFHVLVSVPGYNTSVSVDGTVSMSYRWDEGYASEFSKGSGCGASVTHVPDKIAKDGWEADVSVARVAGNTIVFKIEVSRNKVFAGSAEISYYVDEYGQVS